MDRNEARKTEAALELVTERVARAFRRGERNVNASLRADEVVVNVEAVAEHDVLTITDVWFDFIRPEHSLFLVRDEDHDNVSPFRGFSRGHDFKTSAFSLRAGRRALLKADANGNATVLKVQRVCVTL